MYVVCVCQRKLHGSSERLVRMKTRFVFVFDCVWKFRRFWSLFFLKNDDVSVDEQPVIDQRVLDTVLRFLFGFAFNTSRIIVFLGVDRLLVARLLYDEPCIRDQQPTFIITVLPSFLPLGVCDGKLGRPRALDHSRQLSVAVDEDNNNISSSIERTDDADNRSLAGANVRFFSFRFVSVEISMPNIIEHRVDLIEVAVYALFYSGAHTEQARTSSPTGRRNRVVLIRSI